MKYILVEKSRTIGAKDKTPRKNIFDSSYYSLMKEAKKRGIKPEDFTEKWVKWNEAKDVRKGLETPPQNSSLNRRPLFLCKIDQDDQKLNPYRITKGRGPDLTPRKRRFSLGSEVDRDVPLKDHPWKRGEVTHVLHNPRNPDKSMYRVKWGNGEDSWHSGHKLKESEI